MDDLIPWDIDEEAQARLDRDHGNIVDDHAILIAAYSDYKNGKTLDDAAVALARQLRQPEDNGFQYETIKKAVDAFNKKAAPEAHNVKGSTGLRTILTVVTPRDPDEKADKILARISGGTEQEFSAWRNTSYVHEFFLDHEIAHALVARKTNPSALSQTSPEVKNWSDALYSNEKISFVQLEEALCDSYAMLRHMQRHVAFSEFGELVVSMRQREAEKSLRSEGKLALLEHYTVDALEAALTIARQPPGIKDRSPEQLFDMAADIALTAAPYQTHRQQLLDGQGAAIDILSAIRSSGGKYDALTKTDIQAPATPQFRIPGANTQLVS